MDYFPHKKILEIHTEAIALGLHQKRNLLLAGLPILFIAGMDQGSNTKDQLLLDLVTLNQTPKILGDIIPFECWLRNAAYQVVLLPGKQKYFRELADEVEKKESIPPTAPPAGEMERILFVEELLPFGFLAGAQRVGQSVARIAVPSFKGGEPQTFPNSSAALIYYGTGWLIGRKHVITNHHVINARSEGEADASYDDFVLQGTSASIEFDFNEENIKGVNYKAIKICAFNKTLDYTILELDNDTNRPPLTILGNVNEINDGSRISVNIIQHPGGAAKQLAIRNNLAAMTKGDDLAYYADTKGGSSGSPVCNDQWQVLALHKATTMSFGKFTYQGKETAYVNIGTRIDKIVGDLKAQHPGLWAEIGADIR